LKVLYKLSFSDSSRITATSMLLTFGRINIDINDLTIRTRPAKVNRYKGIKGTKVFIIVYLRLMLFNC